MINKSNLFAVCALMSQKVAFAIRASIAVLQSLVDEEPSESTIQQIPTLPLKGELYLWTFTFPEALTLEQTSRRWSRFNNAARMIGKGWKWMRFFEPHQSHGWHVHCVAAQRYDVTKIRALALKYGFGRMNVIKIPASAAGYVLKYVTKYKRGSSDGKFRLWACCGFRGVSVDKVKIYDSWTDFCYQTVGYAQITKYKMDTIYRLGLERWASQTRIGDAKTIKQMNPAQSKVAIDLLNVGAKIAFIEYRGNKLREAKKYIDGRASLSEKTYYSAHLLEAGNTSLLAEDVLPDSFRPTDTLQPAMKKGQTAVAELLKVSVFNGKETYQVKFHAIA